MVVVSKAMETYADRQPPSGEKVSPRLAETSNGLAREHGAGKAKAAGIDARDVDALARALEGADVLLNTASYRINLEAMQACLRAGCHYLDLGGLYWMTGRQLERLQELEQRGCTFSFTE